MGQVTSGGYYGVTTASVQVAGGASPLLLAASAGGWSSGPIPIVPAEDLAIFPQEMESHIPLVKGQVLDSQGGEGINGLTVRIKGTDKKNVHGKYS